MHAPNVFVGVDFSLFALEKVIEVFFLFLLLGQLFRRDDLLGSYRSCRSF